MNKISWGLVVGGAVAATVATVAVVSGGMGGDSDYLKTVDEFCSTLDAKAIRHQVENQNYTNLDTGDAKPEDGGWVIRGVSVGPGYKCHGGVILDLSGNDPTMGDGSQIIYALAGYSAPTGGSWTYFYAVEGRPDIFIAAGGISMSDEAYDGYKLVLRAE